MNRLNTLGLLLALSAPFTLADFRYDQSSRMTGGSMMALMKLAGKFSKGAMDPVNSTIAVKGSRMVMNHGKTATIYDLDRETITDVNFEKKEYSVTTFAEMKAWMEKNMKNVAGVRPSVDLDVKETGKEETVAGMKAREFLMTVKMDAANPQTGKTGEMQVEISNWLAQKLPGYDELSSFYLRMAPKLDMASMFGGAQRGGMGKGLAEAAKRMAEMDGIPVLQIVRMTPTDPEQLKQIEAAQQSQASQPQQPVPSAGQVAGDAAGQAAASAVAGRMGRLGGLGSAGIGGLGGMRKKKQEAPAPEPVAVSAPEATGVKGSFSSETSMMEMTIECKNHSNSPVDDGIFAIPAGFKTVKGAMQ